MLYGSTTAAFALVTALMVTTSGAQAVDDGKYPNWKGQWSRVIIRGVEVQGAFDQTKPWGPGQQAPLTAEYQKVLEQSMAEQAKGGLGNYPTALHAERHAAHDDFRCSRIHHHAGNHLHPARVGQPPPHLH